jgi:superfamily I DNA and/or RNA helicase
MFSVANEIAYNYQMVKVTPDSTFNINLGKSQWIDVPGKKMLNKNTVSEEITLLVSMVDKLYDSGYNENIFIISPFRLVASHCDEIFRCDERIHCGTVHRFQGKEADIVFLVLGSDPSNARAREWASSQPNLLNVAVTRAKKRLYVIGNKKLWGSLNYFNVLCAALG